MIIEKSNLAVQPNFIEKYVFLFLITLFSQCLSS